MNLDRRQVLALGVGAAVMTAIGLPGVAVAAVGDVEKAIAEFTKGAEITTGKVVLSAPQIAENGNTVPIEVTVESEMTQASYVDAVMILAAGNPNPGVATFKFSPMSGEALASTRIRLAKTQDIIVIARMNDGSCYKDQKTVKVTIGGCGG
ncbi:MAG: thiosulfate oxidation carrier protein SoxY [Cohaesibacteraceae bacterium]|nr:thiosulfate oxidation carrier protein SoxY [Cohaesibacteraceae bacterium]MBL4876989.1 thiosulfate oxidation carrier protein SoxY [Cohaesibacteraceae bacterium]